jgi:hypothetical protein
MIKYFFLIGVIVFCSCGTDNAIVIYEENGVLHSDELPNVKLIKSSHLITDNSVGDFRLNQAWQNVAKTTYGFDFVQTEVGCNHGSCSGGYMLGLGLSADRSLKDQWEDVELEIELKVANLSAVEKSKYSDQIFYNDSPNYKEWFWKDTISIIHIYSTKFMTKEGVGIGSSLKEAENKLGKLKFNVGWIEEDPNAVSFSAANYPDVSFILSYTDLIGEWEEFSHKGDLGENGIDSFKEGASIKRIVVGTLF